MTNDLSQLPYMYGHPVEKQYVFPYNECYYGNGTRLEVECLHEWKQKIIEKLETFKRKALGQEVPLHASTNPEIRCIIPAHMLFFIEQRRALRGLIQEYGINTEASAGYTKDNDGKSWRIETISIAGHYRLWAKLKK